MSTATLLPSLVYEAQCIEYRTPYPGTWGAMIWCIISRPDVKGAPKSFAVLDWYYQSFVFVLEFQDKRQVESTTCRTIIVSSRVAFAIRPQWSTPCIQFHMSPTPQGMLHCIRESHPDTYRPILADPLGGISLACTLHMYHMTQRTILKKNLLEFATYQTLNKSSQAPEAMWKDPVFSV